jgi:N-acetylmuramoyl-L-alanine amidase
LRRSDPPQTATLINSYRFGQLGPGKSRIIIELGSPARIVRAICDPSADGAGPRLVIELTKTDRASFKAAVESSRPARAEQARTADAAPAKAAAAASKPVVMIDPGHGGIDSGAMVNGLVEKDLVFDFATALAAKLRADARFTTVLTRTDDSFIPLSGRVKMARDSNAALFVSIHADILSESDVAGATVYTVSDRASDAEAARVAEKENQSDALAGVEGGEEASGVSDILFDLTRRETRAYSHVFARTLTNYWKVAGRLNKNPQRSAGFRVLKAPDVPSVLLELGYLSNRKDDASLSSAEWREKAAGRVADAIGVFFDSKQSPALSLPADKDWTPVGKVQKDSESLEAPSPPGAVAGVRAAGGGQSGVDARVSR